MIRCTEPPRVDEIWRSRREPSRAAVVLACHDDAVSYTWLDAAPEPSVQVEEGGWRSEVPVPRGRRHPGPSSAPEEPQRISLAAWQSEFEVVFEKEDHADATPARRQCLIDDFAEHYRGSAVLELGAHTGGLTRSIVRHARALTVVENNARCIPVLEAQFGGAIEVIHDDMHHALWRLPPRRFDVVVCAGVLYHSAHPFALLEAMAYLEPRLVLIDTLNDGVAEARVVPAIMTNRLNYRYNRYPDCGYSIVLGTSVIESAMRRLGYPDIAPISKAGAAVAPEHDSAYFQHWRRGFAAWFRRGDRSDERTG